MRRIALLLALLLALSLAACGSSKQETPAQTETVTEAPQSEETPEPSTQATESGTEATEPVSETSEAETEPSEAETEASEPESEPSEAETEAPEPQSEPVQAEDDPLAYTVSKNKDGNFEYVFDVLLVTVPGDWEGKYTVERSDSNFVSFYHTRSNEAYQEAYGFGGGFMFGISLEERGVDPEYPSQQYLGYARDGQDYYMVFPTDVQGYMEDEDIFAEWNAMMAQMDVVEEHSYSMLFHD